MVKLPLGVCALLASSSLALAGSSGPERHGSGRVVVTDTSCEILGPIEFAPNDAHLAPAHQKMIKAVAQTMLGNPSIALMEVEGYADGAESYPDLIGLARATAVMAALVTEGVPMYRLQVASVGATQPLERGAKHPEHNRRIAFLIVRRDG